MCGRYAFYEKLENVVDYYKIGEIKDGEISEFDNRNIAPTVKAPIVYEHEGVRKLALARFGLIPLWVKTEEEMKKRYTKTFNARSEDIFDKPSYRNSIKGTRCIIPMNNFFEWPKKLDKVKHDVIQENKPVMSAAGVMTYNKNVYEEPFISFSMLTKEPSDEFAFIHHREPVFLNEDQFTGWLDRDKKDRDFIESFFHNENDLKWNKSIPLN